MRIYISFLVFLALQNYSLGDAPPTRPPEEILTQLTQGNIIPVEFYYVDDSNSGNGTHYKYSFEDISELISQYHLFVERVLSVPLPPPPISLPSSPAWLIQLTNAWLVHALSKYPITEKQVVVFGSTSPRYEAMLLAMGAGHITVIEYNRLTYTHPNISTILVKDLTDAYSSKFDIALSLTSFDHDGLGRYGDPIDPDGDLKAMETVKRVLKGDGLLIFTVPIGPDVIVWNLHRRYGKLRLPHLLRGWEGVECIGWKEELVMQDAPYTQQYEPVFILRPLTTTSPDVINLENFCEEKR